MLSRFIRHGQIRALILVLVSALVGAAALYRISFADSAVTAASATQPPKAPVQLQGPFAVILVVDAARYDEFDPARMPNLARLMAQGTAYTDAYVGQLPSVTEASHATIGTGMIPKNHLILGDTWRIPGTQQMSPNLLDGNLTRTGYIGKLIQQSHVTTLGGMVHARWPGSVVVSLSGHKVYAADGMGAGAADFVGFGVTDSRGHYVPSGIPGHAPPPSIAASPQLDLPTYPRKPGVEDAWATTLALKFLFKYHPRLMMINLPEVDIFGHASGTKASVMQPLMSNVDKQIGRLVAAYGRAGMLSRTYFVVTADHGMTPSVHTISDSVIKNTIKTAGGQALYVGHGDYSEIWLKNAESIPRVASALAKANIPNTDAVYMRDPRGKYIAVSPSARLADPTVGTAYSDLLGTFNQGEAPDIVLLYDENTITMTPAFAKAGRKGDHGGASWAAQHIPLVITGPDIKRGSVSMYPARLADIAPTVETLLLVQPYHQDGVPLADAMTDPPGWATSAQVARGARLSADVRALQTEAALRPNLH